MFWKLGMVTDFQFGCETYRTEHVLLQIRHQKSAFFILNRAGTESGFQTVFLLHVSVA